MFVTRPEEEGPASSWGWKEDFSEEVSESAQAKRRGRAPQRRGGLEKHMGLGGGAQGRPRR